MKRKPVVPRRVANDDVERAVDWYLAEDSADAALGFIDALEKAYDHMARHPASGSTRYASELALPGLRTWPVSRFPYIVFYVDRANHVDVWRVLYAERDVAAWLREPEAY
jgi:toxin ParE1/3/4